VRWLKNGEYIEAVLMKLGLSPNDEDAKERHLKLAGRAI
jgi:hypothetical protein